MIRDLKMSAEGDPWLAEGFVRDHISGQLHRVHGEFHRPPDGLGWSDRNLALMLRVGL